MNVSEEDFEDYKVKTAGIFSNLSAIAEELGNMAIAKSANPQNPRFIALLKKHKELTDSGEKLHSEMLDKLIKKT